MLERAEQLRTQHRKAKDKLYAVYPYEFGVKVGIAVTARGGLIVGARSFPGNPYDGDKLAEQLEQDEILSGEKPRWLLRWIALFCASILRLFTRIFGLPNREFGMQAAW